MSDDIRFKVVEVPYSIRERIGWWWAAIKYAIADPPPKTWKKYVEVKPEDPEYATTPFVYTFDEHPMRFGFPKE